LNLHRLLLRRAAEGRPVRVAVIGAGKFGSMFLHQAPRTPGLQVLGIADLSIPRARDALARIGWTEAQHSAPDAASAARSGATFLTEDAAAMIADPHVEVVVEATGDPAAGLRHARHAIRHGKHVVMVNVEADVLAGPVLAREAEAAGVVYSMAYGDQPALVAEMVDTVRAAGFGVVAAGKGTKYLPEYHASTPATVWDFYGLTAKQAAAGGMNPRMFNSFLDGTKSGIEMAAIANATGLAPPEDGLAFPPCGTSQLPNLLRPHNEGGILPRKGMVEVVSSLTRQGGEIPDNLRWGVYVVFEGRPTTPAAASPNTASRPTRPAATPRSGGPTTSSGSSSASPSPPPRCGGSRPAPRWNGRPTAWRWPSARSAPGRSWTARGERRSGASAFPPPAPSP
jgi:predicted homoserine dehydrogenase-like protein